MTIDLTTLLAGLLHGAIATAVTVHVLLAHQNVRSSIGWIGLAWLSPFFGSLLYLALGINRVQRRAARLGRRRTRRTQTPRKFQQELAGAVPPHILKISKVADQIAPLPLTHGNTARVLRNGDEAYPAMIAAIKDAKHSVAMCSYIFCDDEAGQPFVDALIAAHERGVQVRVLVDGIGGGYFHSGVIAQLKQAGVPARQFLHEVLPWQMPFINLRNHKKVLIVDGAIGFTGGMNVSAYNLPIGGDYKVRDVHGELRGPIVEHLMLTFASDWDFTTGEKLEGDIWWPDLSPEGPVAMRAITSGPDDTWGRIETIFLAAVECAHEHVRILTPYFLPEDHVIDVLHRAVMRGVKVEILVPARSNHFYFNWAFYAQMASLPLNLLSCHLIEGPFDHSKLMSVDGRWGAFGSANWDVRSMRLNFELLVECYGEEAVDVIDAVIDEKLAQSTRLTHGQLAGRPLWQKLRDSSMRLMLPYL